MKEWKLQFRFEGVGLEQKMKAIFQGVLGLGTRKSELGYFWELCRGYYQDPFLRSLLTRAKKSDPLCKARIASP